MSEAGTRILAGLSGRSGRRMAAFAIALVSVGSAGAAAVEAQVVDTLGTDTLMIDTLMIDTLASATEQPDSVGEGVAYSGPLPGPADDALRSILTASPAAPGGMGLWAAGMAEARTAAEHVALAGRDSTNLSAMQRHMAHVLHAVDPGVVGQGPGMGYGVRRAAREILQQAERIRTVDGLPGVMDFHAPFVAQAARGTMARIDRVVELARQVQRATSARSAHRTVVQLTDAVRAMAYGYDADADRRIGATEDEMGLAQVRYHLALVERLTR